jgi:hypothetical protein
VHVSGGSIEELIVEDLAVVEFSGGLVASRLAALDESMLRGRDVNFRLDGQQIGPGPIQATSGRLTGALDSGEAIDNLIFRESGAMIVLVPQLAALCRP